MANKNAEGKYPCLLEECFICSEPDFNEKVDGGTAIAHWVDNELLAKHQKECDEYNLLHNISDGIINNE